MVAERPGPARPGSPLSAPPVGPGVSSVFPGFNLPPIKCDDNPSWSGEFYDKTHGLGARSRQEVVKGNPCLHF